MDIFSQRPTADGGVIIAILVLRKGACANSSIEQCPDGLVKGVVSQSRVVTIRKVELKQRLFTFRRVVVGVAPIWRRCDGSQRRR